MENNINETTLEMAMKEQLEEQEKTTRQGLSDDRADNRGSIKEIQV